MKEITIEIEEVENSCFVIMPFNSLFNTEYEKVIQPAIEGLGLKCIRGDEIYSKQRIMDDIWVQIRKCRFVLAELTDKNPNVLYELGLAHAIGKPVLIITRNEEDVPFDLKALRYLFYNVNDPFWGDNLKIGIQNLGKKIIENPAIDKYLEGIKVPVSEFKKLKPKSFKELKKNKPKFNLSGTWIGSFNGFSDIEHHVVLQLEQNDYSLFGSAIISYKRSEGEETVVQQIMNGTIHDDKIEINGVNYTYIRKGNSIYYNLDNFILNYIESTNSLKGDVISQETYAKKGEQKLNTKIEFQKNES